MSEHVDERPISRSRELPVRAQGTRMDTLSLSLSTSLVLIFEFREYCIHDEMYLRAALFSAPLSNLMLSLFLFSLNKVYLITWRLLSCLP